MLDYAAPQLQFGNSVEIPMIMQEMNYGCGSTISAKI
jgi:predicted double-glycine peptidase